MIAHLHSIINYMAGIQFADLVRDPRFLIPLIIIFVLSIIFKWKWILSILLLAGGTILVTRYLHTAPLEGKLDPNMAIMAGLIIAVGGAILYILFLSKD